MSGRFEADFPPRLFSLCCCGYEPGAQGILIKGLARVLNSLLLERPTFISLAQQTTDAHRRLWRRTRLRSHTPSCCRVCVCVLGARSAAAAERDGSWPFLFRRGPFNGRIPRCPIGSPAEIGLIFHISARPRLTRQRWTKSIRAAPKNQCCLFDQRLLRGGAACTNVFLMRAGSFCVQTPGCARVLARRRRLLVK